MKSNILLAASVVGFLAVSCGGKKDSIDSAGNENNNQNNNNNSGNTSSYRADELNSIRYSGSLLVAGFLTSTAPGLTSEGAKVYEISAPLFPLTSKLYPKEAGNYPDTAEEQTVLGQEAYLTFEKIRDNCIADGSYEGIKAETDSVKLTAKERADNFSKIATCSYERYYSKPYSIPQLVDDVDLCKMHLGADWNMIKQSDLESFSPVVFDNIETAYSKVNSEEFSWGAFYFSLATYVRGTDGTLKIGSLYPDATSRVAKPSYVESGDDGRSKMHLEQHAVDGGSTGVTTAPVSLRCMRVVE